MVNVMIPYCSCCSNANEIMLKASDGQSAFRSYKFDAKSDDKLVNTMSKLSQANDYSIDKLLNSSTTSTPSNSSLPASITSINQLSSAMVLNQLTKSQLPLDILAQTLWLQHQHHFQNRANNSPLYHSSNNPNLMANSAASPIMPPTTQLRRYLLPQQRQTRGPRRQRTTFTHEQTLRLEMEYHVSEYITRGKRFQLAELLDLSENQIKIWFQNRRAKDKRIEKAIVEQQYRYLSSTPFAQQLEMPNCTTCNYTKQQFSTLDSNEQIH